MKVFYIILFLFVATFSSAQESKETQEEAEVLFGKKEKVIEVEDIPEHILKIAVKGNKVFLQSADNNTAIHAKNYIEKWGYWIITPDLNEADFVLKFYVRFQGPGTFFVKAEFMNPETNEVLHITREVSSIKDPNEFNKKRSAVNQLFKKNFTENFK